MPKWHVCAVMRRHGRDSWMSNIHLQLIDLVYCDFSRFKTSLLRAFLSFDDCMTKTGFLPDTYPSTLCVFIHLHSLDICLNITPSLHLHKICAGAWNVKEMLLNAVVIPFTGANLDGNEAHCYQPRALSVLASAEQSGFRLFGYPVCEP